METSINLCIIVSLLAAGTSFSQVNTEQFRRDSVRLGFSGNLNLEAVVITGNTDFQLLNAGGRLNYNFGDDYTFLVLDAGYGWNDRIPFVGHVFAHLRHVVTTSPLLQLEFFTQYDNNKQRLLINRELIGSGVRLRVLTTEDFKLRVGTAYMFEVEEYALGPSSVHEPLSHASRMSSYVTLTHELRQHISLISVTYYQPRLARWSDFRILSENALVIDAGSLVDISVKFSLRFDSRPPDTIKKTDTITKMGIRLKF